MHVLADDVQDNLIVRVADATGRVVAATYDGSGQADVLAARFDFVFQDWSISARSRHQAAAQVLQSNAFTNWMLTILMTVAVVGGVLLMWRAAERERRLSRLRSEFVADVSHELRTPLASLAVFGELLCGGRVISPSKVVEYGGHIERESNRLRHLIDNVLDFARIESAGVKYSREETSIEDVVYAAVSAVDARRKREGFTISVACVDTLLPGVCVDAQAMTQVVVNLLDNAMKYSGRSRRVRVGLSQRDAFVAVGVTDYGIGIAPADQERIFHQFYRAEVSGHQRVSGTGLGLAIVRHIVRGHEGRIEVESIAGCGSTFTVLIPVAKVLLDRVRGGVETRVDRAGLEAGVGA